MLVVCVCVCVSFLPLLLYFCLLPEPETALGKVDAISHYLQVFLLPSQKKGNLNGTESIRLLNL